MNTRSIRFRLVAWYAGLLIVVFVILGGAMYGGIRIYLERSLGEQQVRRAVQIADTLLANIAQTGEAHVVNEINSWFAPETNDRFIRITHADGSVLYLSANPKDLSFDASCVPAFREMNRAGSRRIQDVPPYSQLVIASIPFAASDGKEYQVEVGASLQPIREVLHQLLVLLISTLAAVAGVGVGGGYFLIRRALA